MITILGTPRYIDCMRPVAHKQTTLGYKWIDVCQCAEFTTKQSVKIEELEKI